MPGNPRLLENLRIRIMPFYDYRCAACGNELEALRKISDPPLLECPACGKPALQKQLSAPAFRLKGGGWYETDFKSGNKKNLHDAQQQDKPAEGGKTEAKGEAKPAAAESKAATATTQD
jgi:putative FmdB family regulatory protein